MRSGGRLRNKFISLHAGDELVEWDSAVERGSHLFPSHLYSLPTYVPSQLIFPPHLYGGVGDDDAELPPAWSAAGGAAAKGF